MEIELNIVGGTHKNVRCNVSIKGSQAGILQMDRAEFTKLCDLIYPSGYTLKGLPNKGDCDLNKYPLQQISVNK